jgi:YD repeat-containing protein
MKAANVDKVLAQSNAKIQLSVCLDISDCAQFPPPINFSGMKLSICLFLISACVFAQSAPSIYSGPVYDQFGHLAAYVYPDGKKELYTYDSQWRMTSFRDRNGKFTAFPYASDNSTKTSQAQSAPSSAPSH